MSSASWLTRVHCRGFQGHSKPAVTSEHFKINVGHCVKRLHCRAVWLDGGGGKCLKMEAELWCEWPLASTPHPEKKKKNLWNNEWATPFNNGWAKQWNSTIYWTVISVPGYDSIHVCNLQLETPLSMSNQNIVSVKAYCSDNGALLSDTVWEKLIFSECCSMLAHIDFRDLLARQLEDSPSMHSFHPVLP